MTSSMKSTLFLLLSILRNGLAVSQTRAVIDVHLHDVEKDNIFFEHAFRFFQFTTEE